MRLTRKRAAPYLISLLIGFIGVPGYAQSSSDTTVFYVSPDEYEITVPTTCPFYLLGGFRGELYGYEHAGYSWDAEWSRTRVLTARGDLADYVPRYGGPHMTSRNGMAIWYNASIRVRCTATRRYLFGRLLTSLERYSVVANFGTVTPVDGGSSGCGSGDQQYLTSDSLHVIGTPNDPDVLTPSSCGGSGGSGDLGDGENNGSGDNTQGATFAAKCESLGGRLYYDIVDLAQWNETTGEWQVVWSGVAAICET